VSWWFGSGSASGLVQGVLVVWFRECWWFGSGNAGGLVQGVLVVWLRECWWFDSGLVAPKLILTCPMLHVCLSE